MISVLFCNRKFFAYILARRARSAMLLPQIWLKFILGREINFCGVTLSNVGFENVCVISRFIWLGY